MTESDPKFFALSPPGLTVLSALPRVAPADFEAAAARISEAVRRVRAEPQPDATWDWETGAGEA
jgi:hypothetical protein